MGVLSKDELDRIVAKRINSLLRYIAMNNKIKNENAEVEIEECKVGESKGTLTTRYKSFKKVNGKSRLVSKSRLK
jgi:hypothetical protein